MTDLDSMLTAFKEIDSDGPWQVVGATLERIDIAGEVIEQKKRQYPDRADEIHRAFTILNPAGFPDRMPGPLFELHCQQVIDKVVRELDLDQPTSVEMMIMLCKVAEKAPIKLQASMLILADPDLGRIVGFEPVGDTRLIDPATRDTVYQAFLKWYVALHDKPRSKVWEDARNGRR